jgi:hypothetical protein
MHRRGLLLAAAGAATATRAGAQQPFAVALGGAHPGQMPQGFSAAHTGQGAPAAWSVVDDASVPEGRMLRKDAVVARDVEVVVRFKAVAGRVGIAVRQTAGLDRCLATGRSTSTACLGSRSAAAPSPPCGSRGSMCPL